MELSGIGIRDEEYGVLELPSSVTNKKLYELFCFDRVWVSKSTATGSYSSTSTYKLRRNDDDHGDMADWSSASQPGTICSWSCFCSLWTRKCPLIKVRPPSRDICTDCFIFRNMHKFSAISHNKKDYLWRDEDDDIDECDEEHADEIQNDNLILRASSHVEAAIAQKLLFRVKI